ncbi:hypothetical protein N9Q05_01470 [bacterium]|nr:hypothetical protein [bacterium]
MGKGGGSSAPTKPVDQTVTSTRITGQAKPYYGRLLKDAEAIYNPMAEYQSYGGQRVAQAGEDQLRAADMARGIAGSGIAGLGTAMDVTRGNVAAGQALAGSAQPYQFGESQFSAADTTGGQFDPTQMFDASAAEQYMSPYIQNVLNRQTQEARRQFDIGQGARDTQAIQAGAFGGSRSAVEQAMAEEALQRQMGDIYGTGMQSAYQDAQQAFQSDRGARFAQEQAQMAERARAQELGADEAGRVQAGTAAEAGRVQESQALEDARARAEQLTALGFSSEQAMQMAGLGETARAADIQGAQMLEALGQTDEARRQAGLDVAYQDFLRQEAFPQQQLQGMSSILQGVPVESTSTQTAYAPSNLGREILGTGIQAVGAYKGLTG